ncbi:unnamed protein product, partial [Mesorhabditis belari]|uniref:Uncharacterized protein n=1 Tax=Mesorhabditis belari TaxID=2138241 RepID=A0AAF3ESP7_9BILA
MYLFGFGKKKKKDVVKSRDKGQTRDHLDRTLVKEDKDVEPDSKKKDKKDNSCKTRISNRTITTTKRNVADLSDCKKLVHGFVENTLKKGVQGLRAEFASHKRVLDMTKLTVFLKNPAKNRYKDVGCLDETRVVLKDNGDNDYIHANYVSTPTSEKRFICCQAPLDSTCVEHWKMIVQERVEVILMLCNLTEKGAKKCADYFPAEEGHSKTFDKYTIKAVKTSKVKLPCPTTANIRLTKLVVEENGNRIHSVDHYHWVDWPDRGVPPADLAPIHLLNRVSGTQSPIVVHCSAGIGRTGSIVLIQYTLESINTGQTCENMDTLLLKLRKQRANSVQTDHQYLYVHQVLLNHFLKEGFLDKNVTPLLEGFTTQYKKFVITG